jgi:hypothetical protein
MILTEVVQNISNQTQEPSAVMNVYFKDIPNNTFRKAVNNVINSTSTADINAMAAENLNTESAATGTV